jgi:Polyketide cyclase / dehydrase and lipid transport
VIATTAALRHAVHAVVHARVSEEMPASCAAVFDLVHDYHRRLEWDTLLRAAYVEGGGPAARGEIAVCSGRWLVGGLTLRTVYVSFERGEVAAVKMVNQPPLFASWAASIRHEPQGEQRSRVVYTYNFRAKPRWLAWLLEPVLALVFRWETRRRLRALQRELGSRGH